MADDRRGGIFAAAAVIAGLMLAAAGSTPARRERRRVGPALPPPEPQEAVGEEEDLALNLDNVAYIRESSKVSQRTGMRGTVLVLTNGTKLEGVKSFDGFRVNWPTFTMSIAGAGGLRRVRVNPSHVIEVMASIFIRRMSKERPDTVIVTMGDSVVVRESVDEVRRALGRGGSS